MTAVVLTLNANLLWCTMLIYWVFSQVALLRNIELFLKTCYNYNNYCFMFTCVAHVLGISSKFVSFWPIPFFT